MTFGISFESLTDISLPGASEPLEFTRYFSSKGDTWWADGALERLPKPFGTSPRVAHSADWWHNGLSVVVMRGRIWSVRDRGGALLRFQQCSGTPCWSLPDKGNAGIEDRLQRTATGFKLHKANGDVLVYEAPYAKPSEAVRRFFLSRVEGRTGATTLELTYQAPPGLTCPQGATGTASGVPYVSEMRGPTGSLVLKYRELPGMFGETECVLDRVEIGGTGAGTTGVGYGYTTDGGVEWAGQLASATSASSAETYSYAGGQFIVTRNGVQQTKHTYGSGARVSAILGPDENVSLTWSSTPGTCQVGSNCCGQLPRIATAAETSAGSGSSATGGGGFTRTYETLNNFGQRLEPRLYRVTEACTVNGSCVPGSTQYEWDCSDAGVPGQLKATKDLNGNWTVNEWAEVDQSAGASGPTGELRTVKRGASAKAGTDALEREDFTYTYGAGSTQLLSTATEASVLNSGQTVVTTHAYDSTTNRLKATIRSGWTKTFSAGTWSGAVQRHIGTFYFTRQTCLGSSTDDPLGRVLEIHGPCWVSGPSATGCDGGGNVPIAQNEFWPEGASGFNVNRLKKTSRLVSANPSNCIGATALATTYDNYDAWGNAQSVTDENGVTSTFTFNERRVLSRTTASQTTQYSYDGEKLSAILHPEGNYEVFCYRAGTSGAACTGGTVKAQLQWKAKSAVIDGATWSEKVSYTYWPDGSVDTETYRDGCASGCGTTSGEIRRVEKHATNAHRMPTWHAVGDTSPEIETRRFDGEDNLTGIGHAYTQPPVFCGTYPAFSPRCTALSYDRANRLSGMDRFPIIGTTANGTRTCFESDVQGNVKKVTPGCPYNTTPGDCSSCSAKASEYQHDDFGNVLEATLPWTDSGSGSSGTTRYAYDAQGNLLVRQTPTMQAAGEHHLHTYDSLGRELALATHWSSPSAGSELLFTYVYDAAATPDASCPQPTGTMGRVLYRDDSFGRTWYRYDAWGRVLSEIRLRTGVSVCGGPPNDNPHTTYSYTANGNLSSVTYPFGRVVTYAYGSGGKKDRVDNVSVTTWNGTSWSSLTALGTVTWEPYGDLRAYQTNHPTSANASAVEYLLGGTQSAMGSSTCPTTAPNMTGSDRKGRMRGLWVSTGTLTPGTASGDIFKRTYTWEGGQVKQTQTCLLGAATGDTQNYVYDGALRLSQATRPANEQLTLGGTFASRSYSYDLRDNRSGETYEDCVYAMAFGSASFPDRLTQRASSCSGSILKHAYTYDADGRVTGKTWANDSTGTPAFQQTFGMDGTAPTQGGLDTVFKSVSVNGATYNYFYDAQNRRRLKVYPSSNADEYFYDTGHQLLVDRGNASSVSAGNYTEDDYVWLGGRPVLLVRGSMDSGWVRQSDTTSSCARNGEAASCGFYFLVTDHIGKPVVVLNGSRQITGIADYDPFGHVNRVTLNKETVHPTTNNANTFLAMFMQPPRTGFTVKLRLLLNVVDTESNAGTPLDAFWLKDYNTDATLLGPIGGNRAGQVWTGWATAPASYMKVSFTSNSTNCCPNGSGGLNCTVGTCPSYPNYPYKGVAMEGYEYQRYQTGAQPFWTPLRFPGQYFDAETDLFENWNRYYEPTTGRYLQPEPMAQKALGNLLYAHKGQALPPYSYALNNPFHFKDPDGNCATTYDCCVERAIAAGLDPKESCGDVPAGPRTECFSECESNLEACKNTCFFSCPPPRGKDPLTTARIEVCESFCEIAANVCRFKCI